MQPVGVVSYIPSKVGIYKFQAHFPATNVSTSSFLASDSEITEVTVQADPIPTIPDNPLPTGYWTRPVYGENKGWYKISGNWLMAGYDYMGRSFGSANAAFAPSTTAPDTAHILWTKPIMFGGIVGGPFGDQIYYEGLSYEQHYNPLILSGRIIFTEHDLATTTIFQTRCVDLYTGEDIWILPNITIACAQVLMTSNPNEHGGVPYLISTSGPAQMPHLPSTTHGQDEKCSLSSTSLGAVQADTIHRHVQVRTGKYCHTTLTAPERLC